MTDNAPLQVSLRLTNKSTDLGGLLPMHVPKGTIVFYDIRYAARKTGDSRFVFGHGVTGTNARQCPFRKFIIPFPAGTAR